MDRLRVATVWLGGCSGCHMSFLDLDEWLFELAKHVDVVYSPIADVKEYPENVDLCLVEGAVANEDHVELMEKVRACTRVVMAFGDCAVTGNVTAMRNTFDGLNEFLQKAYVEAADIQGQVPREEGIVPVLIDRVKPLGEVVKVDAYLPGCPPPACRIQRALEQLLTDGAVTLEGRDLKFG